MLSLSESRMRRHACEIVSCLTGRVCYQVVANCSLEADGVGRLHRPEISGVGKGLGCVCRAVAMVNLGRLWAARVALARSCVSGSRSTSHASTLCLSRLRWPLLHCSVHCSRSICEHMHVLRPCRAGLRTRGLVRTLQRLRSMCACLECEYRSRRDGVRTPSLMITTRKKESRRS